MTPLQIAQQIDGIEYPPRISKEILKLAKENGIVIAYGESDDLLELEGAIFDEFSAWGGTTIALTKDGLLENKCPDERCPYFEKLKQSASKLEIVWNDQPLEPLWIFKCPWPHETFNIMEEGEIYCIGVVFALKDVA